MENSLAVANGLLELAINAHNPPTQMKLQKLIFFAHGWHLALYNSPLISETFEAWRYGPVAPSVYHEFKNFGVLGIDRLGTTLVSTPDCMLSWIAPRVADGQNIVKPLLQKIWDIFGSYSGTDLSKMTHARGTPWSTITQPYGSNIPLSLKMPDDVISAYFKTMIQTNG